MIATVICGGPGAVVPFDDYIFRLDNRDNRLTPCQAYQLILEYCKEDLLIYIHDDVTIHDERWMESVINCFQDERWGRDKSTVGVGLGGAVGLANRNLYRAPYNIWNMARSGYASNQTDAEVHGERFTGIRRVAVLDAFFMAVRVDWLRSRGGWPVKHLTHHCLDLWLACEAARDSKEIWMTGVSCTHHGGGSSTKPIYSEAKWLQGGTLEAEHTEPHRWIYEEYRDVLPIEICQTMRI